MLNFRAFSRSLNPGSGKYAASEMDAVELSGERLVFETVLERGPFRDKSLTLSYTGDFELVGDEVLGSIAAVSLAINGTTHFEIIPNEPIDVDEFDDFLKDVSKVFDRDDENDDADEDDDDNDDDDGDEDEDEDEDDEDDDEDEEDDDEDDSDEGDDSDGVEIDELGDFDAVEDLVEALWGKGIAFRGGRKDDDFDGDDGDDEMDGGAGDDELHGGKGKDKLSGGEGDDDLSGGKGGDKLFGGRGDDELYGGSSADVMHGGAGADTFIFAALGDLGVGRYRDVIRDFAGGRDEIDLSTLDADLDRAGDQRFDFVDDAAFSGRARELRFDGGVLRGDIDGDGVADFQIKLAGATLTSDDFVL